MTYLQAARASWEMAEGAGWVHAGSQWQSLSMDVQGMSHEITGKKCEAQVDFQVVSKVFQTLQINGRLIRF